MRSRCAKPPNEHAKELLRNGSHMVPIGERRWKVIDTMAVGLPGTRSRPVKLP
jgi:hypothetical protein